GGFAGTETDTAQRGDPLMNPTVLSGDIGVPGDSSDNSYHLVTCAASVDQVVLDGLIFQDALANGPDVSDQSGAAIVNAGEMRLAQCIIRDMAASGPGKAIWNSGPDAVLIVSRLVQLE
ncbi:MAG: hypothetical protein R3330_07035, partial [Saprospiraceae bacterium]|nr:hypothetical protein [Saprospiraceae bacterium]